MPWEGHEWDRALRNKNKILWTYEGANGVKPVIRKRQAAALWFIKKKGMQLIAVVLNCGPMFEESAALMDYGFANFRSVSIVEQGQFLQNIPVIQGTCEEVELLAEQEYSVALNEMEEKQIRTRLILPAELTAPVKAGQWIGSLQIYHNHELLKEIPIVTGQAVEKKTIWNFFRRMVNLWR
jgi:D-alanyl-D-alanine carboxypeptidase (penicillin-binding protein 5/6)